MSSTTSSRWGFNPSTLSLLAVILLIAAGYELFKPFMSLYIAKKDIEGNILLVGLYGTFADIFEGIYYRVGGRLGGRLGARRSLFLFCLMPIAGAAIMLSWQSVIAPFLALPLLTAWDSISAPATLRVVGETLPSTQRTLALSLQSIMRRVPRVIGYVVGGIMMVKLGNTLGVKSALVAFMVLAAIALAVQLAFLREESKDSAPKKVPFFETLRLMPRDLKLLLASDIFVRLCEGFPRELVVLYLTASIPLAARIDQASYGRYIALNAFVSLILYLPIGIAASKPGAAKKPYIGLTFVFFALFPLAVLLGARLGTVGLIAAFVVMGMREIGEPARKAMITELLPPDRKTEATGIYWSARSFSVMIAPFLGALAWKYGGPEAPFWIAGAIGAFGAVFFYATFARGGATTASAPATPP